MKSLPSAVPSSPGTLTFAGSQSIDILERRTWGPLPEMIHRAAPGALAGVELSHLSPPWLTEGPQGLWECLEGPLHFQSFALSSYTHI